MPKPKCYMCEAVKTSKEHVPPKNLFPEARDAEGVDYRINLITVPSCDEHNSEKSHDDEFLLISLAGIMGSNFIGYSHRLNKVDRAIRNSAGRLLNEVLIEKKDIYQIDIDEDHSYEVVWGTPDIARLNKCFVHMGYGLHQHHFRTRFVGQITVLLGYLVHADHNTKTRVSLIREQVKIDLRNQPVHGSNKSVFQYQVTKPDQFGLFLMCLTFYEKLPVYLTFAPVGVQVPPHPVFELLKRGVNTVVLLDDKEYEFNSEQET
jgi:hypothetical protein